MKRKRGYEYSNMTIVKKTYRISTDGQFVVLDENPKWKHTHLSRDCVLRNLVNDLGKIIGYRSDGNMSYWIDINALDDDVYVVRIPVQNGSKKMNGLIELGFE